MERRIPTAKEKGDTFALRQLIRDLEEARALAVQAERRELAESLGAWVERLERSHRLGLQTIGKSAECEASEIWLG